jgi:hypothetical protein
VASGTRNIGGAPDISGIYGVRRRKLTVGGICHTILNNRQSVGYLFFWRDLLADALAGGFFGNPRFAFSLDEKGGWNERAAALRLTGA